MNISTYLRVTCASACMLVLLAIAPPAAAQWWDLGQAADKAGLAGKESKLDLSLDVRTRYEARDGVDFGAKPDYDGVLVRTRLGLSYTPVEWLKFSGMMQDSRSPLFGSASSSKTRGTADLQEGYLELFPSAKRGIGLSVGRRMMKYGDGRLINTPDWGNVNRTFDHARLYYRLPKARLEFLFLSQAKTLPDDFNEPRLGDRVWGMYNVFPDLVGDSLLELYVLRRDLNRTAGFKGGDRAYGTDRLGITAYGARMAGPLGKNLSYKAEGVVQRGKVGPARQRAYGWASNLTRRWEIAGKAFDLTGEYKYASGTANPGDTLRTNTFDTFYASNHNRFGHQDLFGWRNIHNVQALAKYPLSKGLALNAMYNNSWLASARDALYTNSGGVIAQDPTGAAGRHVGQEVDFYLTYKYRVFQFGAGYGYFMKGDFIRYASSGVNSNYFYVFHTYSF